MVCVLALLLVVSSHIFAIPQAMPIPRSKTHKFLSEGTFVGGSYSTANLHGIRFSAHLKQGFERWVIDFSNALKKKETKAPRFQIRYIKASKVKADDVVNTTLVPPKFIVTLQSIKHNHLSKGNLARLTKRSRFVKEIVLYPSIENGDMAVELLLHDSILFDVHQPIKNEGRLVLDLKNAPL